MKEILEQSLSTGCHDHTTVNSIIIPPPNSRFVSTQKSVGLYSAHYGIKSWPVLAKQLNQCLR